MKFAHHKCDALFAPIHIYFCGSPTMLYSRKTLLTYLYHWYIMSKFVASSKFSLSHSITCSHANCSGVKSHGLYFQGVTTSLFQDTNDVPHCLKELEVPSTL